jgi:hypothetical protein
MSCAAVADMRIPLLAAFIICLIAGAVSAFASSAGTIGALIPLSVPLLALGDLSTVGFVSTEHLGHSGGCDSILNRGCTYCRQRPGLPAAAALQGHAALGAFHDSGGSRRRMADLRTDPQHVDRTTKARLRCGAFRPSNPLSRWLDRNAHRHLGCCGTPPVRVRSTLWRQCGFIAANAAHQGLSRPQNAQRPPGR